MVSTKDNLYQSYTFLLKTEKRQAHPMVIMILLFIATVGISEVELEECYKPFAMKVVTRVIS